MGEQVRADGDLLAELERAQGLGFLGPGPVDAHVDHGWGFAPDPGGVPARLLDLGSGGGIPGLVLARLWPAASAVLLDAGERRCAFLESAVDRLGLGDRVTVLRARAEEAGRDPGLRGAFDLVVARSFGPPPVTAECAAPFLRVGGRLVVSEPPGDERPTRPRWPADGLAMLGLGVGATWRRPYGYQALLQREPCPDTYPRRVGVPAKGPLF